MGVPELCVPESTLHIDSKVLNEAEAAAAEAMQATDVMPDDDASAGSDGNPKRTRAERAEWLRRQVNTVGQPGRPGAHIQHVISVGMLSEGWDARTVTHIMGLRAFTSQLLCEQVVGRGLRRTSYDVDPSTGLLTPEYVNVFGVPFRFLPHEGDGTPPPPVRPTTRVEPDAGKRGFEIRFPNVVRIERALRHTLTLDIDRLTPLELDAAKTVLRVELAPSLEGKPHALGWTDVDLQTLVQSTRLQTLMFEAARRVYTQMRPDWTGATGLLVAQVVALVERFVRSPALIFQPADWGEDGLKRRALLMLDMNRVVNHVWAAIVQQNAEHWDLIFDEVRPVRSTADMRPWYTSRPCEVAQRSHINFCVYDSAWESSEAYELDHNPNVAAWVKNDHLGFEIAYMFQGVTRKYRPDFLVRLTTGGALVLETKGQDSPEARAKHDALNEWVTAVNAHGGFGHWAAHVSRHPRDVAGILARASETVER